MHSTPQAWGCRVTGASKNLRVGTVGIHLEFTTRCSGGATKSTEAVSIPQKSDGSRSQEGKTTGDSNKGTQDKTPTGRPGHPSSLPLSYLSQKCLFLAKKSRMKVKQTA